MVKSKYTKIIIKIRNGIRRKDGGRAGEVKRGQLKYNCYAVRNTEQRLVKRPPGRSTSDPAEGSNLPS